MIHHGQGLEDWPATIDTDSEPGGEDCKFLNVIDCIRDSITSVTSIGEEPDMSVFLLIEEIQCCMSIISSAERVYKKHGFLFLAQEGIHYLIDHILFQSFIWELLPEHKVKSTIADSRVLTTLLFAIRQTFYTEQRAVLHGQALYHEFEKKRSDPEHRLIRNVHRLEKGLSMKNRRPVFAEGYIEETVTDAIETHSTTENPNKQLWWALDVLDEYFETVEETEVIRKAAIRFNEFKSSIEYESGNRIPQLRKSLENDSVSYKEFRKLAEQRTSTRWFQQKPVPRELVDKAVETAVESPSACNRQPFEFRIYDDEDIIEEITKLPVGVSGYEDNIPCIAVIVGKQRAYFHNRDRHVIYIDASLAAMSFQFGLETLGLASCCINWPVIPQRERKMSKLLSLDDDEQVIMLMAIGYPDPEGMIPYSEKKNLDSVRSYNKV